MERPTRLGTARADGQGFLTTPCRCGQTPGAGLGRGSGAEPECLLTGVSPSSFWCLLISSTTIMAANYLLIKRLQKIQAGNTRSGREAATLCAVSLPRFHPLTPQPLAVPLRSWPCRLQLTACSSLLPPTQRGCRIASSPRCGTHMSPSGSGHWRWPSGLFRPDCLTVRTVPTLSSRSTPQGSSGPSLQPAAGFHPVPQEGQEPSPQLCLNPHQGQALGRPWAERTDTASC